MCGWNNIDFNRIYKQFINWLPNKDYIIDTIPHYIIKILKSIHHKRQPLPPNLDIEISIVS